MKQGEYLRIRKLFLFGVAVSLVTILGGEIGLLILLDKYQKKEA